MESISFIPVFNLVVSDDEIIKYFTDLKMEYPKKTNGKPHMGNRIVKQAIKTIMMEKEDILKNQYKELIEKNIIEKKKEVLDLTSCKIKSKEESCPICYEPFASSMILECSHALCSKCAISHFRKYNTCPLCRAEICDSVKKIPQMSHETIHEIMHVQLNRTIPERHNMDMYNYINHCFHEYKYYNMPHPEVYIHNVCTEVMTLLMDMGLNIVNWYDEN